MRRTGCVHFELSVFTVQFVLVGGCFSVQSLRFYPRD
jgi:hypothetical protein